MFFDTIHIIFMLVIWVISSIVVIIKDWKNMTFGKLGNLIPFTIMFSFVFGSLIYILYNIFLRV